MKAYVIDTPGASEVLSLRDIPDPVPDSGQVLIEIAAFGLNRAEVVTRAGGSGNAVQFPRVIGIECVGTVLECPDKTFSIGQTVAAVMGGMGRQYNGSYAEQTVVPIGNVFPIRTTLSWVELAAIPQTFLTAWGCLFKALKIEQAARVVVRPGASALGLAITQIVNQMGGRVIGVTRSQHKVAFMLKAGMAEVIVSDEPVASKVKSIWSDGPTGIVETVTNAMTISDGLKMKGRGRLCIAGSLSASSGKPPGISILLAMLRPSVTMFSSETLNVADYGTILQTIVDRVEAGEYQTNIAEVVSFDNLPHAHTKIDANQYVGKVVVQVK